MDFYTFLESSLNEADEKDWPSMLNAINPSSMRPDGPARHHNDDHTARAVAADYLQDLNREKEAALLRDQSKHIYRHNGAIHDAHEFSKKLHNHENTGSLLYRSEAIESLSAAERLYLQTALWASTDGEHPLDNYYNPSDISLDTIAAMITDWRSFRDHAVSLGILNKNRLNTASRDFWLSRNGHGSGFLDFPEEYGEEQSKELHELAERYGEYDLYVGHDQIIHGTYAVSLPPKPPKKRRKK